MLDWTSTSYRAVPSMLMVAPIGRTNLTRRKVCQNSPLYHFVTKFSSVSVCSRPWNPAVNFVLLLQRIDGDWKSGGAGSCSKRRHYCVPHVGNEPGGRGWGKIRGIEGGNFASVTTWQILTCWGWSTRDHPLRIKFVTCVTFVHCKVFPLLEGAKQLEVGNNS